MGPVGNSRLFKTGVLSSLHSGVIGGHLGEEKTLNRLRERFYWLDHTEDLVPAMCAEEDSSSQEQSTSYQHSSRLSTPAGSNGHLGTTTRKLS